MNCFLFLRCTWNFFHSLFIPFSVSLCKIYFIKFVVNPSTDDLHKCDSIVETAVNV